jgi:hypothetical protein
MGHFEKIIPIFEIEGVEELRRRLAEIEAEAKKLRDEIHERHGVRLQLWARKCLQHSECCELKASQVEFLETLLVKPPDGNRGPNYFEVYKFFYDEPEIGPLLGPYWRAYPTANVQKHRGFGKGLLTITLSKPKKEVSNGSLRSGTRQKLRSNVKKYVSTNNGD